METERVEIYNKEKLKYQKVYIYKWNYLLILYSF